MQSLCTSVGVSICTCSSNESNLGGGGGARHLLLPPISLLVPLTLDLCPSSLTSSQGHVHSFNAFSHLPVLPPQPQAIPVSCSLFSNLSELINLDQPSERTLNPDGGL